MSHYKKIISLRRDYHSLTNISLLKYELVLNSENDTQCTKNLPLSKKIKNNTIF